MSTFTFAGTAPSGAEIIVRRVQIDTASGFGVEGGAGHVSDQHVMAEHRVTAGGAWEIASLPYCDRSVADTDRTPVAYQVVVVTDSGTDVDKLVRVVATDGPGPHDPATLAAFTHPRLATFSGGGGGGGPTTNTLDRTDRPAPSKADTLTSTVNGVVATSDIPAQIQSGQAPRPDLAPWLPGDPLLYYSFEVAGGPGSPAGGAQWVQMPVDLGWFGGPPGTIVWSPKYPIGAFEGSGPPVGVPHTNHRLHIDVDNGGTVWYSDGTQWLPLAGTVEIEAAPSYVGTQGPVYGALGFTDLAGFVAAVGIPALGPAAVAGGSVTEVSSGHYELSIEPAHQLMVAARSSGTTVDLATLAAGAWNHIPALDALLDEPGTPGVIGNRSPRGMSMLIDGRHSAGVDEAAPFDAAASQIAIMTTISRGGGGVAGPMPSVATVQAGLPDPTVTPRWGKTPSGTAPQTVTTNRGQLGSWEVTVQPVTALCLPGQTLTARRSTFVWVPPGGAVGLVQLDATMTAPGVTY